MKAIRIISASMALAWSLAAPQASAQPPSEAESPSAEEPENGLEANGEPGELEPVADLAPAPEAAQAFEALEASVKTGEVGHDDLAELKDDDEEDGGLADSVVGAIGRVIEPYGAIAGGLRIEGLALRPDQTRQSRHPTVAVSRLGLRGRVGEHIRFRSEMEANLGGPLGYGSSVWEGQAMLSIRDQYLQYDRWGVSLAAGRVTDSATVDFTSSHVLDLLGTDVYVRDPLLFSGYDRGTGLFAKYEIMPGLRAGLTFHSTNPTGLTGTLLIGGDLFPYDRPFYLSAAAVGRNEFMLPDQNLHIYFATPSLEYADEFFEFKSAIQAYQLDTQMSTNVDERILGYNLRASAKLNLLDGLLSPFFNASRNQNEMLDPQDATIKLADIYRAVTLSGGFDLNYAEWGGLGIQYANVQQQRGDLSTRMDHYLSIGHTFWIEEGVSLAVRYSAFMRNDDTREPEASLLGVSGTGGHQSLFLTSRLIF
jgi:hypothetical protein